MNRSRSSITLSSWLVFLAIVAAIGWSFSAQQPASDAYSASDDTVFSQQRALAHLNVIAARPHYLGSAEHERVREYLVGALAQMGLTADIQHQVGTHFRRQYSAADTRNIIARIPGSQPGNALILMSHYDSGLHSSLGASDAGSGVVTILEAVRAFLARGETPLNDIVILLTDGEERGLLGAEAFVGHHPWASQARLVLNLEARGSGGPSYMLMETNGGNADMIRAFSVAGLKHPAANSLMYSLYKQLPNDTDLTVFREQGDIPGFNFAFIDDHFDYHTAQDSVPRLDANTLNHQAEYLTTLLDYFADADLASLESEADWVYFNAPGIGMISYPFAWNLWLVALGVMALGGVVWRDWRQGRLGVSQLWRGVLATSLAVVLVWAVTHFGWHILKALFPQYAEIPHGFTYNGHWILASFIALGITITLALFRWAGRTTTDQPMRALYVAPVALWLVISGGAATSLPGAGFLVIPPLLALAAMMFWPASEDTPRLAAARLLLALLPVLILAPLIPAFVIGLGLNAMAVGTVLTALTLALLLPLCSDQGLLTLGIRSSAVIACGSLVVSMMLSGYSEDRRKPNSINYILDSDTGEAWWTSSNRRPDSFVGQFLTDPTTGDSWPQERYPAYRSSRVRWYQDAPVLPLAPAKVTVTGDVKDDGLRTVTLSIQPQRPTAVLQLVTTSPLTVRRMRINGEPFKRSDQWIEGEFKPGFVLTNTQASPLAPLTVELSIDSDAPLGLKLLQTAYDMPELFEDMKARSTSMMPEPFIINDAVIISQRVL